MKTITLSAKKVIISISLTLIFSLIGCNQVKNEKTLSWQSIYTSQQCSIKEAKALIEHTSTKTNSYQNEITHINQHTSGQLKQIQPVTDQQSLITISMGQKYSGGYSVNLLSITEQSMDQHLKLTATVNWQTPPKDAMTSSALTSPCEIIAIDRTYTEQQIQHMIIELVDQSGQAISL